MRDPLYKDEMEQYLEDQVDQHRLYPSDHVWRNIQDQLHEKVRWPALPFILLFIIAALVVGTLLVKPEEHFIYRSYLLSNNTPIPVSPAPDSSKVQSLEESLATGATTQKTIAYANERLNSYSTEITVGSLKDSLSEAIVTISDNILGKQPAGLVNTPAREKFPVIENITIYSGSYIDSLTLAENQLKPVQPADVTDRQFSNGAANSAAAPVIKLSPKETRWSFQLYATPSNSYRRLVSGKNSKSISASDNVPLAPAYTDDVNNVVKHKPASGFEAGFAVGYQLNKQFTVKAGLQYNVRRYDIAASSYSYEKANVALSGQDTLTAYTPYRNLKGGYAVTLQNEYHELSVPISISWKGWQHRKFSWHVSASVQPTLVLTSNAYIISTDYKNYVSGASLLRKWNLNTSFETFFSYQTGDVNWQIGPQFRYQQFSTFKKEYPVREFLLDYGIKIGMTMPIR